MSETYNGWTNYETWLVALWLDNDETHYSEARILRDEDKGCSDWQLGEKINEYVESLIDQHNLEGFILDLINSALQEVNWKEIAESLRSEITEVSHD